MWLDFCAHHHRGLSSCIQNRWRNRPRFASINFAGAPHLIFNFIRTRPRNMGARSFKTIQFCLTGESSGSFFRRNLLKLRFWLIKSRTGNWGFLCAGGMIKFLCWIPECRLWVWAVDDILVFGRDRRYFQLNWGLVKGAFDNFANTHATAFEANGLMVIFKSVCLHYVLIIILS